MDYFPYDLIKGRRDARLVVSEDRVYLRDWCKSLGARVGVEPEETKAYLTIKLKCGLRLARDFERGYKEKHQLLLISAMKDQFTNSRAMARDGSTPFDRHGLMLVDIDQELDGMTFEEMKLELKTFLYYPVVTSPSGNLKIFIPLEIKANAPWNYDARMVCTQEFLTSMRFLPEEMGQRYWDICDKSHSGSRVFFANEEILNTILEFPQALYPLVLEPISEMYSAASTRGMERDRSGWMVPNLPSNLIGAMVDWLLELAPPDKKISPRFLADKMESFEKDRKANRWIEKYIHYVEQRSGAFSYKLDLTLEQKCKAKAYGKSFFTKLTDYLLLIQIMISQPAIEHQRSLKFFQEVLRSREICLEKNYIHRLLTELEEIGLIEKTAGMERHKKANTYKLLEPLATFYFLCQPKPTDRKPFNLPEDIPDHHWNETFWKCSSKFRCFDNFYSWAQTLPSFGRKKNRIWHVLGAWNSSIKRDFLRDNLRSREAVLVRISQDGEILKEALAKTSS